MSDALLIVGHGSRGHGQEDVLSYYVDKLSATGRFSEVAAGYLERSPFIQEVLGAIRADRIFIMPLLVAPGYHTSVTIPKAVRAGGAGKEVVLLEPLGRSEHIVRLIEERVDAADHGSAPL